MNGKYYIFILSTVHAMHKLAIVVCNLTTLLIFLAFPKQMWIFVSVDVVCSPLNCHDRYFMIKTENVSHVFFGIKTACLLKIRTYPLQSKIACKKEPFCQQERCTHNFKIDSLLNSHFHQEDNQTIGKNILSARFCAPYTDCFLEDLL